MLTKSRNAQSDALYRPSRSRSVSLENATSCSDRQRERSKKNRSSRLSQSDGELIEMHSLIHETSRTWKKREKEIALLWANTSAMSHPSTSKFATRNTLLMEHKKMEQEQERRKIERRRLRQEKMERKRREKLAALGRLRMELEWKALQRKMLLHGNKTPYLTPNVNQSRSATWYENASQLDYCWPTCMRQTSQEQTRMNNKDSRQRSSTRESQSRSHSTSISCMLEEPSRLAMRLSLSKRMDEHFRRQCTHTNIVHDCEVVAQSSNTDNKLKNNCQDYSLDKDKDVDDDKKTLPENFGTPNAKLFQGCELLNSLTSFPCRDTLYRDSTLTPNKMKNKANCTNSVEHNINEKRDLQKTDVNDKVENTASNMYVPQCNETFSRIALREIDSNSELASVNVKKGNVLVNTSELDLSPIPITKTADNSCLIPEIRSAKQYISL